MFSKLGVPMTRPVLNVVIRRYGDNGIFISLTDFVMATFRYIYLSANFEDLQRKKHISGENIYLSKNEFLEVSMLS
ncbi:hypothetical protein Btru_066753 [Bulinus truncatus]|nr:hypothetical protein Btru_066753 [Bulinus truncatus]